MVMKYQTAMSALESPAFIGLRILEALQLPSMPVLVPFDNDVGAR